MILCRGKEVDGALVILTPLDECNKFRSMFVYISRIIRKFGAEDKYLDHLIRLQNCHGANVMEKSDAFTPMLAFISA